MPITNAAHLSPTELVPMLRRGAEGAPDVEAATGLVIAHGQWLERADFRHDCIETVQDDRYRDQRLPIAVISWQRSAAFAESAPASTSEAAVLRLACSLAGVNTGALRELTGGLSPVNTARVLDALAHRAGWHQRGMHHSVDGRQDRVLHDRTPGLTW